MSNSSPEWVGLDELIAKYMKWKASVADCAGYEGMNAGDIASASDYITYGTIIEDLEKLEPLLSQKIEEVKREAVAKARLDEATNWHRFDKEHDDDSWCCKREQELRDEVMALEAARP